MSVEAKRGPPPPVHHFSAGEAAAETMRLLNLLPFLFLAIPVNVLLVSLTFTSYLSSILNCDSDESSAWAVTFHDDTFHIMID